MHFFSPPPPSAELVWCDRCNGADAQIHGFFFFANLCQPMAARRERSLAGFTGDRRPPVPIAESVGGVAGFGGVSDGYESTAAHYPSRGVMARVLLYTA